VTAAPAPGAVLFAAEYYPPFAPGGAEWSNAAWAAALARRGVRVVVVTPNYGAAPAETQDGVRVVRVPFPLKLAPGQRETAWLAHRNPAFALYFAWHLARVARPEGVGVIHAQQKGALVAAWLAGRRLGLPVLATIRDTGLLCPLGLCPIFEPWKTFDCSVRQYARRCAPFFLEHYHPGAGVARRLRLGLSLALAWPDQLLRRAALARVDGVIGVSRGILAVHPERLVDAGRASVVHTLPPLGAPATEAEAVAARRRFGIGAGPLVLYAGKLSLGKGAPVLFDAIPAIAAAAPGARFVFAGKGELVPPSRPDVLALGVVARADLFALYRAASVVVVPSVWPEPFSRVLLEAMHAGRAVVATAVGGTPEAVEDRVSGLLVPRNDAAALARAVTAVLADGDLAERLGKAAAQRVADVCDEERQVTALLDAYSAAAARR
jgi:glycosyltransferase involved in cell wall biosynthesis